MVEKARRDYYSYTFFHWYNEYQRPRAVIANSARKVTSSNVTRAALEALEDSSEDEKSESVEDSFEVADNESSKKEQLKKPAQVSKKKKTRIIR